MKLQQEGGRNGRAEHIAYILEHLRTNISIQNLMDEVGWPEFSILSEQRESRCDTNLDEL